MKTIPGTRVLEGKEAEAFAARIDAEFAREKQRVKDAGYTSCEGFYWDEDGEPRSLDEVG